MWSFSWASADAAGVVSLDRVYTDAIPEPLRVEASRQIPPPRGVIRWRADRCVGPVEFVIEHLGPRVIRLNSSHYLGSSGELMQVKYARCRAAWDGEADADLGEWTRFCEDAKHFVPADAVVGVARLRAHVDLGPTAFTVRHYEGVMPDVELVHQAFAAEWFRSRCNRYRTPPVWVHRGME